MSRQTARETPRLSTTRRQHGWRRQKSEDGVVAIMTAVMLIILVAMFGIALDLSRAYNRKMELQSLADATALAAANALDGTSGGIDNAVNAAASSATFFNFSYNKKGVSWSPGALTFSTGRDGGSGGWLDAASAKSKVGRIFFARVDTSVFTRNPGEVENVLMPLVSPVFAVTHVSAVAVAGRDSLNAMPLAVCAKSNTPAAGSASGELLEYGFRRGVSYDLMNATANTGPSQNFLLNPIAPAGTDGTSMMGRMDIVAAYVCTGKLAIPSLQGGDITVEPGFPVGSLYQQLNSRFGTYVTPCQPSSAPTDAYTKSFDLAGASWIKNQPTGLSVGPLWTYAKAVKYTAYSGAGGVEPSTGYTTYGPTDWATLYPGTPAAEAKSYLNPTPYQNNPNGATAYKRTYNTRVLRIPLLRCPVPSGSKVTASVLGIGKFFMTIPATSASVYAEFAGMESWAAISGNARLYQ